MREKDNLVLIILSGISCSGKSRWVENMTSWLYTWYGNAPVIVISKDAIRKAKFGENYKINPACEKYVDNEFFKQLGLAISFKHAVIIIDNPHCKEKFLDNYMSIFRAMFLKGKVEIYMKFFDIPLWKAQIRNILRYIRTGEYTPFEMMKSMYRSYHRIDRKKYKHLIPNDF